MLYQYRFGMTAEPQRLAGQLAIRMGTATRVDAIQRAVCEYAIECGISIPPQPLLSQEAIDRAFAHDKERRTLDRQISEVRGTAPLELTFTVEGREEKNWLVQLQRLTNADITEVIKTALIAAQKKYGLSRTN